MAEVRRRRLGRWVKWLAILAGSGVVLGLVGLGVGAYLYDLYVIRSPGPHLDRDHILAVIAEDSPVTYRDGTTRLGVFFQDEHRSYVGWRELPPAYVAAIVAAEDGAFWQHRGVSPKHIARAMYENLLAGRTVAGGSTLTQQTAKNIFYRPDRSLESKLIELLNALRLEAHYDKSEILTFYVNQFHVSGNGRGLGIAARYFFDAEVSELDLLQSAFLAGLVKAPSFYDPYLGDPERQERSRERAIRRTRYVLRRIVDQPTDDLVGPWPVADDVTSPDAARRAQVEAWKVEATRLLDEGFELPFKRGRFRYDSDAVLDEVRRRLAQPPFDEVLKAAGVEDPTSAGLVVVTTLDADVQREATYGLWHHLTEAGSWLEQRTAADFIRADSPGPRFDPYHPPRQHQFRLARVVGHPKAEGRTTISLDLGGHACTVDRDGLIRAALAVQRGEAGNVYVKVPGARVDALAQTLEDGAVVWVSVREVPETGPALCDLELRPELQGAVVVTQDGEIRAMVAGNDNQNFNRVTARRQFGSTWKPLIFHAALQLGWTPDEPLDNRRNVFPFSTTFYYPRPDHTPDPIVSMSWAGARSENLASVWLLYHLTDRLDGSQVAELARTLDLARREGETEKDYRNRIQRAGVLPTRSRLREGLFLKARQEVLAAINASSHPEDALGVASMLYGWGHGAERRRVAREGPSARSRKSRALNNSFVYLEELVETCRGQHEALVQAVEQARIPEPGAVDQLWVRSVDQGLDVACGSVPEGYVRPDDEALAGLVDEPVTAGTQPGASREGHRSKSLGERLGDLFGLGTATKKSEPSEPASRVAAFDDVLIDERLHAATFQAIASGVSRREAIDALAEETIDLYAPDVLYWHQDFRVLLAMRYVAELARQYGVRSEVRTVLSMPLGASELTLEEATAVYAGITSGEAWDFQGEVNGASVSSTGLPFPPPDHPSLLIAEIRDVDGRVLYKAKPTSHEVAEGYAPALTSDILRNVVVHGTGRRASAAVTLEGGPVPVLGKTGTTNDFRNAAFLGVAPYFDGEGWRAERGTAIGVYVGYDDNRPMARGRIRLAGASGALPVWIAAAQGAARAGLLGEPPPAGGEERRLMVPSELGYVEVDPQTGLPIDAPQPPVSGVDDEASDDLATEELDPTTEPDIARHAVLVPPSGRRAVTGPVPTLDPVVRVERVAPSTEEAAERARRRRELLERLRRPQSVWDEQP